jgi:beta-mannosidase
MNLSGTWKAAAADEGLRRSYPDPDFDDAAWRQLSVPGHWRSTPAFAAHDGPLLYRRRFEATAPADGRRAWLTFDGIFYQGDVWLDGSYVGDTEGYFFPHTFEVTDALRRQNEHLLAVEVTCSRPVDLTTKRNLTGVFQHWDCADPAGNPGGIWRAAHLTETGPVRIARLRVLCTEATAERAVVEVRAILDAASAGRADVRATVTAADGTSAIAEVTSDHALAAGENRIHLVLRVDNPELWWPHTLGTQALHDVTLTAALGGTGISDSTTRRTGLRQVRMKRWITTVNGERLFLKGANQGPTRMALAEASPADLDNDVLLAKRTGLDLLRVHAHVSRPELYEAADRHGLLLWQDLPLQWGYARGVRKQAVRQAREAVDLLAHHPSIAIWCGHNEPLALDIDPTAVGAEMARTAVRFAAAQQLPTWNKTVLDRSIKRSLAKADPTRPIVAHSGILPHPGSMGTDSHFYFGWYHGEERDFPALCKAWPALARFITEFGAQAVPENAEFMDPQQWPNLDWPRLGAHHSLQKAIFDRYVPPADYPTFDAWRAATQAYQAAVVRYHVETLRLLKYRPTGGFCQFSLADGYPAVTWAIVDHERTPKAAWQALTAACAPVIVVATRPAAKYEPGQAISLDIHVVSDLRATVDQAVVTATFTGFGEPRSWSWTGDVPPDSCVKIGTVRSRAPDVPGPLTLELRLRGNGVEADNRYETAVEA